MLRNENHSIIHPSYIDYGLDTEVPLIHYDSLVEMNQHSFAAFWHLPGYSYLIYTPTRLECPRHQAASPDTADSPDEGRGDFRLGASVPFFAALLHVVARRQWQQSSHQLVGCESSCRRLAHDNALPTNVGNLEEAAAMCPS